MKILVVDDEELLVKGIRFNLQNDGYEVICGSNGLEAISLTQSESPDLIILDVMMPEMDGLSACAKIREFSDVPIILLTAKADDMDKLIGFNQGADDYLTKPFNILELKARVRALLRRTRPVSAAEDEFRVGSLVVSPSHHTVEVDGAAVTLSLKEFKLLCLLLEKNGAVADRDEILTSIWGYAFDGESRTVDVHIRNLRQKLGTAGELIETVKGIGYKLERK